MKQESMARPIEAKKHLWYTYEGKKPFVLKDRKSGATITLKKGDLYGVQNINDRIDRVVLQRDANVRILASVETVSDAMDASKRYKQPVEFAVVEKPKAAPRRIKIRMPAEKIKAKKEDRIAAIKKAATKVDLKPVKKKGPQKIGIPAKRKDGIIDFDEDTFLDDDSFDISNIL